MNNLHVDLVRNDLDCMVRRIVGRATVTHDHVKVESFSAEFDYQPVIDEVLRSEAEARGIVAPTELLRSLPERIDSGYLFATDPHDDDGCDFRIADFVPIDVEASEPARLFD